MSQSIRFRSKVATFVATSGGSRTPEPPNPKKVATKVATFDTGLTKGKDEDDEEVGAMI